MNQSQSRLGRRNLQYDNTAVIFQDAQEFLKFNELPKQKQRFQSIVLSHKTATKTHVPVSPVAAAVAADDGEFKFYCTVLYRIRQY